MPNTLALPLLDAALRGTLVALLALLGALMWRDRPGLWAVRAGVVMAAGLCVQVISSTPLFEAQVPWAWQAPLVAVSVGNAVLFWVFVQALFNDAFRPRAHHLAAWLAVAGVSGLNCVLGPRSSWVLAPLLAGLQRGLPLLFAALAAYAAAAHWRDDLVEARRRLRVFIVVKGTAYTVVMVAVRLGSPHGRLSAWAASIDVLLLLGIVAVVAWHLLRLGASDIFSPAPALATPSAPEPPAPAEPTAPAPPDPAEERLAALLQHLMTQERAYRSEDLSVASLAGLLAVPEYRLRRLINQRLGHRNFSAFVNSYRLADACAALADATQREVPVLTIALDAGFGSIGPFNRAFKAATGLTPSDYRRERLPA